MNPSFASTSVIGRKAKWTTVTANGVTRQVVNIITKDEIVDRIYAFGHHALEPILHGNDCTFVPILNGAINFYATLSHMVCEGSHVELMPVAAQSYGMGKTSGPLRVSPDLIDPDKIRNRTLVIVDDILDTGKTVDGVTKILSAYEPQRIITVFLLRKMHPQQPLVRPDYCLFDVHSESWVYGFGMDFEEKYRHLRFIADARIDLYDANGKPQY